jgi:alkanesulfonate monooxygenase SsuD/methylene tetrahydromethanopterin reductase-like flavin-dependent oxidoreductase (luciferase family)
MQVGYQNLIANYHEDLTSAEIFVEELKLAARCEELGFDTIYMVEHHFDDYSMCPDNFLALTWLAAQTSTIKLGTAGVILPWNDPLRVAEKVIMLDALSGGRFKLGMGRGLAKLEYDAFRQDMNESRQRFDEAAAMIVEALRTGVMENDGPFYPQPRVELKPGPAEGVLDRLDLRSVGMTNASALAAADIGAALMVFTQGPIETHMPDMTDYRERFRSLHGHDAPPIMMTDFTYCHEDPEEAERVARRYLPIYFASVIQHYDFSGEHFGKTKGYEAYDAGAAAIRAAGKEEAAKGWADSQIWGTPEQIIEKYRARVDVMGDLEACLIFSYSGMPYDKARASQELFAREVLPALKEMQPTTVVAG